jgi:hypothetical protein
MLSCHYLFQKSTILWFTDWEIICISYNLFIKHMKPTTIVALLLALLCVLVKSEDGVNPEDVKIFGIQEVFYSERLLTFRIY